MSLARLVITAVTVEGRSKSEVARDYGVSRVWVQKAGAPLPGRGRDGVHTAIAKTARQSASGQC
jgi:transposase